jgi:hypothetical protein
MRLEVLTPLVVLDALVEEMSTAFGGGARDYRTQATQASEPLSNAGLRALFSATRAFHRAELWVDFGDEVVFGIKLHTASGGSKTLYGIVMGKMSQEFGMAPYASLDDFRRFCELSLQHMEQMEQTGKVIGKGRLTEKRQQQANEMLAKLMSVSAVGLTFTPQRDVPLPLVEEAEQPRLPIADKSAFPLVVRLGAGGMSVGTISDRRNVYAAARAILDWDQRIATMEAADEIGVTIISKLPAVSNFVSAMTAHTTLRLNPYAPEEEPARPSELNDFFQVLLEDPPKRTSAPRKNSPHIGGGKTSRSPGKKVQSKPCARQLPRPSRGRPKEDNRSEVPVPMWPTVRYCSARLGPGDDAGCHP